MVGQPWRLGNRAICFGKYGESSNTKRTETARLLGEQEAIAQAAQFKTVRSGWLNVLPLKLKYLYNSTFEYGYWRKRL